LNAKIAAEMEAEKAVKAKAAEDMSNWMAQRDIRLRAKKVCIYKNYGDTRIGFN
jgi:hypothetical protein